MTEYIERNEIRKTYEKLTRSYVNGDSYIADWRLDEMIESLPAADVAPVRHERWVKIYENGEPAIEQHQVGVFCSGCKKMPKDRFSKSDFCPSCGARMDGGYD